MPENIVINATLDLNRLKASAAEAQAIINGFVAKTKMQAASLNSSFASGRSIAGLGQLSTAMERTALMGGKLQNSMSRLGGTLVSGLQFGVVLGGFALLEQAFSRAIDRAKKFQTATLAIAAGLQSGYKVSKGGMEQTGFEGFQIALKKAQIINQDIIKRQAKNILTYEEQLGSFQSGLIPAARKGLSVKKVQDLTELIAIAAKATGSKGEEISDQVRLLLGGGVNVARSKLGRMLGIKNVDIANREGPELEKFLETKLRGFKAGAPAFAESIDALLSTLESKIDIFLAKGGKKFVDMVKPMLEEIGKFFEGGGAEKGATILANVFNALFKVLKSIIDSGALTLISKGLEAISGYADKIILAAVLLKIFNVMKGGIDIVSNLATRIKLLGTSAVTAAGGMETLATAGQGVGLGKGKLPKGLPGGVLAQGESLAGGVILGRGFKGIVPKGMGKATAAAAFDIPALEAAAGDIALGAGVAGGGIGVAGKTKAFLGTAMKGIGPKLVKGAGLAAAGWLISDQIQSRTKGHGPGFEAEGMLAGNALQGGLTGAAFGPIGALVGTLTGFAKTLIDLNNAAKEAHGGMLEIQHDLETQVSSGLVSPEAAKAAGIRREIEKLQGPEYRGTNRDKRIAQLTGELEDTRRKGKTDFTNLQEEQNKKQEQEKNKYLESLYNILPGPEAQQKLITLKGHEKFAALQELSKNENFPIDADLLQKAKQDALKKSRQGLSKTKGLLGLAQLEAPEEDTREAARKMQIERDKNALIFETQKEFAIVASKKAQYQAGQGRGLKAEFKTGVIGAEIGAMEQTGLTPQETMKAIVRARNKFIEEFNLPLKQIQKTMEGLSLGIDAAHTGEALVLTFQTVREKLKEMTDVSQALKNKILKEAFIQGAVGLFKNTEANAYQAYGGQNDAIGQLIGKTASESLQGKLKRKGMLAEAGGNTLTGETLGKLQGIEGARGELNQSQFLEYQKNMLDKLRSDLLVGKEQKNIEQLQNKMQLTNATINVEQANLSLKQALLASNMQNTGYGGPQFADVMSALDEEERIKRSEDRMKAGGGFNLKEARGFVNQKIDLEEAGIDLALKQNENSTKLADASLALATAEQDRSDMLAKMATVEDDYSKALAATTEYMTSGFQSSINAVVDAADTFAKNIAEGSIQFNGDMKNSFNIDVQVDKVGLSDSDIAKIADTVRGQLCKSLGRKAND